MAAVTRAAAATVEGGSVAAATVEGGSAAVSWVAARAVARVVAG